MSQKVRSARGQILDFELLAIKQQLASAPMPKLAKDRKDMIEAKAEKSLPVDDGFLAVAKESAAVSKESAEVSKQSTQLHRK